VLDAKVGCLGLTLFGSSGCSAGFTDAPMGFGYSWGTRLLGAYNSLDIPMCVTDDPVGSKCSRVL
jgi:hypothetical protein